jgi:hypothetical protein
MKSGLGPTYQYKLLLHKIICLKEGYIPLIPQILDLLRGQPLRPRIPLASQPLPVLPFKKGVLQHAAAEQENGEVPEDGAVARVEPGCVGAAVDVAADRAVDVAPADDHAEDYAAFVHT